MTRGLGRLAVGCVLVVACGDFFGPSLDPGVYTLASIDGEAAPFILSDTRFADGSRIIVEAVVDSMDIIDESRLVRVVGSRVWRYDSLGPHSYDSLGSPGEGLALKGSTGTYTIEHRQLVIRPDDFGLTQPFPPETLEVTADHLVGRRMVGGWCRVSPPECPSPLRMREFRYRRM